MDVVDLVEGPHQTSWAVSWIPAGPRQIAIARQVSPITYVRPGLPPILTCHGDADQAVPYQQAVRFHAALTRKPASPTSSSPSLGEDMGAIQRGYECSHLRGDSRFSRAARQLAVTH